MKTKILLPVSILLNVVLLLIVAKGLRAPQQVTTGGDAAPSGTQTPNPSEARRSLATIKSGEATTIVVTATNQFDWRKVESDDYRKYIANLRAIGCPEATIRDIIVADVNKLFESRLNQGGANTNKFEFWKTGNFLAQMFDEKKMAQRKQLVEEKRAMLKELLGVDIAEKPSEAMAPMMDDMYGSMLDFLPAEKRTELMDLEQKFAGKIMGAMGDPQKPDLKGMRALQKEKEAELLNILGPQGKEEYDLRMSETAMLMRMQMSGVELSEQEFRDIFKKRKSFDDEFGGMLGATANNKEQMEKRNAAQKQLDEELRPMLGESRYQEYKYASTFKNSSLYEIAQEHNVPRAEALKVFELREVAQAQAQEVRADQSLTPEQRQAALNAIRAETEKAVGAAIGHNALKAYTEKGSSWLKNLSKPASGSARTAAAD